MRKIIFGALFILCYFYGRAQSDFRPGYVITNSMDSLSGYLDYRGDMRNMKVCNFKSSIDDSPTEFLPGEIYAYGYNSGKFYISKEIDKRGVKETVFLEYLLKGINSLYYYVSADYRAYYLESDKNEMLELKYLDEDVEIVRNGVTYIRDDNYYKGILSYAFADFPEVHKEVAGVELSHKSMINITKKYHDYKCSDEVCIIYEKKLPVIRVDIKPLIGYSYTTVSFEYTVYDKFYNNIDLVDFQGSNSPCIGVGFDIKMPRFNEKVSLIAECTFNEDYFYGNRYGKIYGGVTEEYSYFHFTNLNFKSEFAVKYTYPKGKYRPVLFAGIFGNTILKSDAKIYVERLRNKVAQMEEYEPELFDGFQKGIVCGCGLEYKFLNKLRAFSNFSFSFGSDEQHEHIDIISQSYKLSTGLTF